MRTRWCFFYTFPTQVNKSFLILDILPSPAVSSTGGVRGPKEQSHRNHYYTNYYKLVFSKLFKCSLFQLSHGQALDNFVHWIVLLQ